MLWGRFDRSSGKFMIDRAAKKASLELAVNTASVSTGENDKGSRPRSLDEHLRSADFFNVAEFPRMTFKAADVKFNGDNPAEITGELTLLGVTRPLTLKVERWVCKDNPFNKKPMCGGNASGTLKRSDFGMKYALPAVSDEVRLYVGFEGYKDLIPLKQQQCPHGRGQQQREHDRGAAVVLRTLCEIMVLQRHAVDRRLDR